MSSPRVFIIAPREYHDYDKAKSFGVVVPILEKVNVFRADQMMHEVKQVIEQHAITGQDFIVYGGNSVINAVFAALMGRKYGKLRLLIYGHKLMDYTPRDITI